MTKAHCTPPHKRRHRVGGLSEAPICAMLRAMTRIPRFVPLLIAAWTAALTPAPSRAGDYTFQWDNDKVADTDRHYTNGMRIAVQPDEPGEWVQDAARWLADVTAFEDGAEGMRMGWAFGQDMFTPGDVQAQTPPPGDRPYAGWTYFAFTAQDDDAPRGGDWSRMDSVELDLGVVGPLAHAGEVQNWFHDQINVPRSHGWSHQIHDEPGLLATRTVKLRTDTWSPFGGTWPGFDVVGHGTAQLGNVRTGAGVGGTVRFGSGLGHEYGPVYGTFALPAKRPGDWVWSLYAGAEVRAVAWDIFLDGNTYRDSPDVDKKPWVLESRFGIMTHVPLPPAWGLQGARLDVSHVQRTREFETQDKSDRYGSLQLTVNF
ncbi:MAG: lipid A deacylase LpxR family protein [Alphaproteobacteria bacterium]|nr:lipid A deacylase LpxR family protein [Alphaproteobacteria bacterium]